jgi:hypothetical protein
MLLLPEGQWSEAWEPPEKAMMLRKLESVKLKRTFTFIIINLCKSSGEMSYFRPVLTRIGLCRKKEFEI